MPVLLLAIERERVPQGVEERLRAAAPAYELLVTRDRDEVRARAADIEIIIGFPPRELLTAMPNLKWFQQWAAGADWLRRHPELAEADFTLTSAVGIHAVQIGEHVFATLLALARELPAAVLAQRERRWRGFDRARPFELFDKDLLVLGVGAIGGRVAELGKAFGMRVTGLRRNPSKAAEGVDRMVGPDALDEVLPEADVVVLTVPLTDETRDLLSAERIGRMKPGAVLVNIGRGGTVDEQALAAALADGRLRGAALDVFETEPLPPGSPLWGLPNLLVTSHYAGATPRYGERAMALALDNLQRYVAGEPLKNVVDKKLGY
ncbi:MAG: D-2-hydroxyacid dehydrogenase [Deinococcales bacterium]